MPRSHSAQSWVVLGSALLVAAIGFTVQVGWLLGRDVQVPGAPDMTFTTASGLLLCGLALLCRGFGWRLISVAMGLVVMVLGGLTLVEHITDFDFGFSQFVVGESSSFRTARAGRPGGMTALVFVCGGAALVSPADDATRGDQPGKWQSLAVYLVLVQAMMSAWRHLAAFDDLIEWPLWESMAPHSALGCGLLGIGLAVQLHREGRLWLPEIDAAGGRILLTASALMGAGIVLVGSWSYRSLATESERNTTEFLAASAQTRALAAAEEFEEVSLLAKQASRDTELLRLLRSYAAAPHPSQAEIGRLRERLRGIAESSYHILAAAVFEEGVPIATSESTLRWPEILATNAASGDQPVIGEIRFEEGRLKVDSFAPLLAESRLPLTLALRFSYVHLAQIVSDRTGLRSSGEVMLARRSGDEIAFVTPSRRNPSIPLPVAWSDDWAEPMRRALSGEAQVLEALDYRGILVSAAFNPIAGTDWGLVVKVDRAELLEPVRRSATALAAGTAAGALLGPLILWLVLAPVMRALRQFRATTRAVSDATLQYLQHGDLREMAEVILERSADICDAGAGYVLVMGSEGELRILGSVGEGGRLLEPSGPIARGQEAKGPLGGYLIPGELSGALRRALWPDGALCNDPASSLPELAEHTSPIESLLAVPLRVGEEAIGLIVIVNRRGGFRQEDRSRLEELAPTAALAISRAAAQLERQEIYRQLVRSQKMEAIGRLAGGAAHDFNNLLTVIKGNAELALDTLQERQPEAEQLREILKAETRAAVLTGQLLAFGRRQVLAPQLVDLNAIVEDLVGMFRGLAGDSVDLVLELAPRPLPVRVDVGQIEQVIVNLVINARDAMPMGGSLKIETCAAEPRGTASHWREATQQEGQVRLSVSDTGVGISDEAKMQIFEPFFTTKGEQGTGLGLATVYGIVKQHRGSISVESEEGSGAVFRIYLPKVRSARALETEPAHAGAPRMGAGTILVVEDDEEVGATVCGMLGKLGYEAQLASGPDEALRILAGSAGDRFDLLFTDVIMPGMNGVELGSRIKAMRPELGILFTSGYSDDDIENIGGLTTDSAFLRKPFSTADLATRVRAVLEQARSRSGRRVAEADARSSDVERRPQLRPPAGPLP